MKVEENIGLVFITMFDRDLGECKEKMLKYMLCLSRKDGKPSQCQDESKDYFQCRMDR